MSAHKPPAQMATDQGTLQKLEYVAGWDLAVATIGVPGLDPDTPQILTGVDGYTQTYSTDGARDIYTDGIDANWNGQQDANGVYTHETFENALLNGSGVAFLGTLEESAILQYFVPDRAKIAVFGHTHRAMLRKSLLTAERIYANSGTWIDEKYLSSGELNRTCVVINTSTSSGSEIDCVTVYQFSSDETLKNIGEAYIEV